MNNVLVTFDSIVNTDLGLLYMIKDKYNNPDFIMTSLLEIPRKVLINELINREYDNPLIYILKEEYKSNADKLYNEFIEAEYESIISKSSINHITFILNLTSKSNISINILCKNIYEEQFINKYNIDKGTKFNIVKYDTLDNFNVDIYDAIFIKYYKDVLKFRNLVGKTIYVCNYKFNFIKDILLPEVSAIISDVNKLSIIDTYKIDDSYKAIG